MSLLSCIKRNKMHVFRRLYMRRRQTSGEYETSWQLIPNKYIITWPSIQFSIEDIKPNHYKYSGAEISVINNDGYFSDENKAASFFYGYLGIHNTMVKIESGYIGDDDTEYPTSTTLFIGLISGRNTKYKYNNEINFKINHISSIFDDIPADKISSLGPTQTASQLFTDIKNYADSNGTYYFQKYISSTVWNITATTNYYNIGTTTNLRDISCWKLMQKLSEAENYIFYIDNNVNFWFKERSNIPASSSFHFSGIGDDDKTYGHNIMSKLNIETGLDNIYNRIKIKLAKDDTITSYYFYNETWAWGDSSSSFRFGVQEYSYDNEWLTTATAAQIATTIFNEFSEPKQIIQADVKFVPQLSLMNRVSIKYKSIRYLIASLWGWFLYGSGTWGGVYAYNINIDGDYYITSLKHNLNAFKTTVDIKEI